MNNHFFSCNPELTRAKIPSRNFQPLLEIIENFFELKHSRSGIDFPIFSNFMIKKSNKLLFQGKPPTPNLPWVEGSAPSWSAATLGGVLDLSQTQIEELFGYKINFSSFFNFHNNLNFVANRVNHNETLPFIRGKINSKKIRLYMTEQKSSLNCPLFDYIHRNLTEEQLINYTINLENSC